MKKFTRGFTLIELLVVIAIIGILASIVLVSLNGARKKGGDARIISDVQEIRTQLETGYNGSGYPDLTAVAANCLAGVAIANDNLSQCINSTGPGNTNINTLMSDASTQGGQVYFTEIAGNTAYAIRGKLSSNPAADFCIDSTGKTNQAEVFNNTNIDTITCH